MQKHFKYYVLIFSKMGSFSFVYMSNTYLVQLSVQFILSTQNEMLSCGIIFLFNNVY